MSAQALSLPKTQSNPLRPFDMRRDLLPVADLVELCFAESLDADGRLYIRQMRQAAQGPLLEALGSRELPMSGYVWQDGGAVVGNLSLIPHRHAGRRLYLIANVAVHPDYRRHGIARALTQAALQELERRRPLQETWLQVDEINQAAVNLYRGMGFVEKARRTSWRARPIIERIGLTTPGKARTRHPADWPLQQEWLAASYPQEVRWQLPLELKLLQPGWRGALERAFNERRVSQWSAELGGKLVGVLSWQTSSLEADRLWLAVETKHQDEAIPVLMEEAFKELHLGRSLALNYPSGLAAKTLQAAGFHAARTLIWMEYPWNLSKTNRVDQQPQ
jgi:ribosomal protein S18 acetylase RimI-like enzyme